MTKKKFDELPEQYGPEELAAGFVFPAKISGKQKKEQDAILSEALAKRRAGLTDSDKLKASLLQLRFQMEDYLNEPGIDRKKTFGFFLKNYISKLNKKQHAFAKEINIKPAELSQYINNHRTPPQNIIIRLELHSNNIIPAVLWYRLLQKKMLHELHTNTGLRKIQKKFVKKEVEFAL